MSTMWVGLSNLSEQSIIEAIILILFFKISSDKHVAKTVVYSVTLDFLSLLIKHILYAQRSLRDSEIGEVIFSVKAIVKC